MEFNLQWHPFFRVCFYNDLIVFHSRQNFPSASTALSGTSVQVTHMVSNAEIPGHPCHRKGGNVFLHSPRHPFREGTVKQRMIKWIAHSQRKQPTWELSSSCSTLSSRSQTTGYCLLWEPVDISRYLKSDFMSGLTIHIPVLKWYNTVRHQGRLLYF